MEVVGSIAYRNKTIDAVASRAIYGTDNNTNVRCLVGSAASGTKRLNAKVRDA